MKPATGSEWRTGQMNHFGDFCELVSGYAWMSMEFRDELIRRMNAAMSDAYERGVIEGERRRSLDISSAKIEAEKAVLQNFKNYPSIAKLPVKEVAKIRRVLRKGQFFEAIKMCREMSPCSLLHAKKFVERMRAGEDGNKIKQEYPAE